MRAVRRHEHDHFSRRAARSGGRAAAADGANRGMALTSARFQYQRATLRVCNSLGGRRAPASGLLLAEKAACRHEIKKASGCCFSSALSTYFKTIDCSKSSSTLGNRFCTTATVFPFTIPRFMPSASKPTSESTRLREVGSCLCAFCRSICALSAL